MKRFIVLTVLAVAFALLLSGTAMAYTDYIPYLAKGTTGAVRAGAANIDDYGTAQNEAPAGMPNTYDTYALGCFWCHGWEKRQSPNSTNVVDLTKVITSPSIRIGGLVPYPVGTILGTDYYVGTLRVPAGTDIASLNGAVVQGLGGTLPSDPQGLRATPTDNVAGNTLVGPVAGSRWTNLAEQYGQPYGAHGGYSNTTDRCKVCHDVHAAAGNKRLTAGSTAEDICETCHDFTQGISIYGAIESQTGVKPAGGHRVANIWEGDQTTDTAMTPGYTPANYLIAGGSAGNNGSYRTSGTLIPGYMPGTSNQVVGGTPLNFPQTGGVYSYTASSLASRENQLTCTDCHTPHGNTSMRPFKGDRARLGSSIAVSATLIQPLNVAGITMSLASWTYIYNNAAPLNTLIDDGAAVTALVGAYATPALAFAAMPTIQLGGPGSVNKVLLLDVAQILGIVPRADTLVLASLNPSLVTGWTDDSTSTGGLMIDPATGFGAVYAGLLGAAQGHAGYGRIPWSGVALAIQLNLAGALRLSVGVNGLTAAVVTNATSNKLLRDFVNQLDLRQARFGGQAPNAVLNTAANGYNNYDESMTAPMFSGLNPDNNTNDGEPFNQGQLGATAEYGSAFCAACHRGRIGNFAGLVDTGVAGSVTAARLDALQTDVPNPPNADTNPLTNIGYVAGSVAGSYSDILTCTNHPTLMRLAYRNVGELNAGQYNAAGTNGNPGAYTRIPNGLALSNRGFTFWPVSSTLHPDGSLGNMATGGNAWYSRPTAPICQQCHEDSRDIETAFTAGDTDKIFPMNGPVNIAIGLATRDGLAAMTTVPAPSTPALGNVEPPFIQSGNPLFQNFPHETQNYRLLVEGGDSNRVGGGQNDDLCLNCHVPGSTVRPDAGSPAIIFTTLVKDFNGFQE